MGYASTPEEDAIVLKMSRRCAYPGWLLLELPDGRWAALWHAAIGSDYATAVVEGNYQHCACVSADKQVVLDYMTQSFIAEYGGDPKDIAKLLRNYHRESRAEQLHFEKERPRLEKKWQLLPTHSARRIDKDAVIQRNVEVAQLFWGNTAPLAAESLPILLDKSREAKIAYVKAWLALLGCEPTQFKGQAYQRLVTSIAAATPSALRKLFTWIAEHAAELDYK